MLQLEITRGSYADWPIQVRNRGDETVPIYTASGTLSATVWPGDRAVPLFAPNVIWYTAGGTQTGYDQGQVLVSPTAAQSATMIQEETYALEVWWSSADFTRTACIVRGSIKCLSAPSSIAQALFTATVAGAGVTGLAITFPGIGYPAGVTLPVVFTGGGGTGAMATATTDSTGAVASVMMITSGTLYTSQPTATVSTTIPTYCSLNDMEVECSWIDQFMDLESDQAGFIEQRGRAREWFDALVLRAAPVTGMGQLISRQSWWSWGYSGVDPRSGTGLAIDRVLTGYLASNCLMVNTPQGKAIIRANAAYAIALVLRSQADESSRRHASYFMQRAQAEASMITCEVDINQDGRPEYAIALSVTNTRYA